MMTDPTPPDSVNTAVESINSSKEIDPSIYTWTTWFKALNRTITAEETRQYLQARDMIKEDSDCKRCEKHRDWLLKHSPVVTFLRQNIRDLGDNVDMNSSNIHCKRCTTSQGGGFDSDYGILLCANELRGRKRVEDVMAHEMVHAYDHMRFKVDRWNLKHQACTEIRAATLSGECRFGREFFGRGQWKITQQLQECVRRRATLSLMARPAIKDDVQAAKIVNEVWDSCFNDTRPFDEIYR